MPNRRWADMDAALRRLVAELITPELIPSDAGVYAWYRGDVRQYVCKATSLRVRLWKNHLGEGRALTNSAQRREIALTGEQLAEVRAWLHSCDLAWLTCAGADDADMLERELLTESRPPLNRP